MNLAARILSLPILAYRYVVSPLLPGSCRHEPTCSNYGLQALARHGALKGGWLTLKRVARCHPWGTWGYDPVPGADPQWDAHKAALARGGDPAGANAHGQTPVGACKHGPTDIQHPTAPGPGRPAS
ncbi:MAG: membrane protein insertion efficiency factor YidD [Rhodobacterales bacterium]|nr:membrane protein insertion efficiency factor YidD [Rhodobacterales bacterium]